MRRLCQIPETILAKPENKSARTPAASIKGAANARIKIAYATNTIKPLLNGATVAILDQSLVNAAAAEDVMSAICRTKPFPKFDHNREDMSRLLFDDPSDTNE